MADIIQLLPDAIANQIAAGEVIQRPASVVKELLENAIDAGSTKVQLIVKDAGKALIQVIDNGCGMSETDARMSFERHATSKIRRADDLFAIRTMGFRGEALASIAAVAQVELRTRRKTDELGTRIVIEGSELKIQEPCQAMAGTNLSVKNLFFNVPARRNFLKSNTIEMRHVLDEFQRVAIANPDIFFSLHHNNQEIFHLPASNLRQRVTAVLGGNSNKKLVPVGEETDVLRLRGFVGKPEYAKKTRGEQLFFVNHRFIKSGYLNHAVLGAYENLLPQDTFPLYIIFIDIDPSRIDINVHPTKQEIKFEDERLVYNYLKVAVRHALGQHSIMPTLDFEQEVNFTPVRIPTQTKQDQTVDGASKSPSFTSPSKLKDVNLKNWEKLYEGLKDLEEAPAGESISPEDGALTIESTWEEDQGPDDGSMGFSKHQQEPYQIHASFIVSHIKSGFLLIDQQAAHERILYEKYFKVLNAQTASTQQQLFPHTVSLSPTDAVLLKDIMEEINKLGFDVQEFGVNTFVINGVPSEITGRTDEADLIESLLEQYKANIDLELDVRENIARSMARSASIKRGKVLSEEEMQVLIDQLFACEAPFKNPAGRYCFLTFELEELEKRFGG
jgi:DNA mismatch repair protein MutL